MMNAGSAGKKNPKTGFGFKSTPSGGWRRQSVGRELATSKKSVVNFIVQRKKNCAIPYVEEELEAS
ncbi:MAG TPA: hypothetical protein VIM12_16515 [Noviherbaspirillum sp.]|jgi:hypothetical protein|uniref:hypothetical protein n=1 Tax=Noviherbaspirillum sp. TaxID=1926288 RepID=UPI002F943694